jgi:osmotically inducible lipoprotein OsmB
MKIRRLLLVLSSIFFMAGCSRLSQREQRVLSGGAIGAGVGTAGAAILGGPLVVGAAAGAAAGAVGGVIADEIEKQK